ncbi:MAG: transcription antitermination factor NusB [Kiritimatiellaeota bacterium]|nr:transcription antitermination factor NusB [Kiritimatiellota bacterium]
MSPDLRTSGEEQFRRRRRCARECVLQALYQADVSAEWDWSDVRSEAFWRQLQGSERRLPETDLQPTRKFAQGLIRGVVAHREEIDAALERCARNWRVARMSAVDRSILRMAAFELLHRSGTPPVAVIDEAIELAKEFGDRESARFVNGILDRLLRELPTVEAVGGEPFPPKEDV